MFPFLPEIEEGHRLKSYIPVVREGKRCSVVLVHDQVIIPFFDPESRSGYPAPVIFPHRSSRPPRLCYLSVRPEERLALCHFVISHLITLP